MTSNLSIVLPEAATSLRSSLQLQDVAYAFAMMLIQLFGDDRVVFSHFCKFSIDVIHRGISPAPGRYPSDGEFKGKCPMALFFF